MTSLLARLGQIESRRAAQTLWTSGKRKRLEGNQWICADCRARRTAKQRRGYSDDSLRLPGGLNLFPEREEVEDLNSTARQAQRPQRKSAWGLDGPEAGQRAEDDSRRQNAFFSQRRLAATEDAAPKAQDDIVQQRESLWEQFEAVEGMTPAQHAGATSEGIAETVNDTLRPIQKSSLLSLDYKEELSKALARGEADLVIRCLFAASQANDLDFLRGISATTFSEIISLLEPNNFIAKLASAHIELSTAVVGKFGIAPMKQVAFEYNQTLRQVLSIRRSAGLSPTLADYTILLRSARDLGSQRAGLTIWHALLTDGHVPTTQCYNYFMSTVIWNGVHSAGSRQKVRVIPFNMMARKEQRPKYRFRHWRVGPNGIRESAMRIFNEMLANGAIADEESFRILMTASAREGDMATVKSLLEKVWQIHVDALLAGSDEPPIAPRYIPEHSPLRPTSALLFTIAHAFGINNDVPAAIRLVDFVARSYELTITQDVWAQLFEWTFVLAIDRHGTSNKDGSRTGKLPAESVLKLWETMTGHPYLIEPSMGMYNQLIKNLAQRQWTPMMYEKMQEAEKLLWQHRQEAAKRLQQLRAAIADAEHKPSTASLENIRHEWEYADLIRQRDRFWLKRWLRLALGSYVHWNRVDVQDRTYARELPQLLWRWRDLAPTTVKYEIPTGFVEVEYRTHEKMLERARTTRRHQSENRAVLEKARKYIGDRWVRGQERMTRRLSEEMATNAVPDKQTDQMTSGVHPP